MLEMQSSSIFSGRISAATIDRERNQLARETGDNTEMTLMRLRRLSRTVMCKSEPRRFEARKLERSNIVKYLERHLTNPSDKVRYLALELFCCTIPRLENKTDSLLQPLLPKVFQCLQKNEKKELKLKALHFLRCFFRHANSLSGYIDSFVKLGIESPDDEIQLSCCLGLNIVFDQDIGNSLYARIVTSVANILIKENKMKLNRAAYRALKHIHKTIKDRRFFDILKKAHPEACELYNNTLAFEETDSFIKLENTDCSVVVLEYHIKRRYLKFKKDFRIFDPTLLHRIRHTKNCKRAIAVDDLLLALKQISWTEEDLEPHIQDFLKVVNSFVCDDNRLVQMSGFSIMKEIISRMSFTLSPQILWITEILRQGLISANTKIQSKVKRVFHKLMHYIHPMTVMWNLLNTKNSTLKEAVIIFIQNKLSDFSYHEIDMVALCNYLGQMLEDKNDKLAKCSRDCMLSLLDIMRNCPAYKISTLAVRVLLRNHELNKQTLEDLGIRENIEEDYYQEDFESYSDEETTDRESYPVGSTATAISVQMSVRSPSTAGESDIKFTDRCCDLSILKSCKSLCESASRCHLNKNHEANNNNLHKEEGMSINLELHSQNTIQTAVRKENVIAPANKARENLSVESSDTSSVKELLLSARTDSIPSRYISSASGDLSTSRQQWAEIASPDSTKSVPQFKSDSNLHLISGNQPSGMHTTSHENYFIENELGISQFADIIVSENIGVLQKLNSSHKPRKYFTRFCMKADDNNFANESEKLAGRDSQNIPIMSQSETDSKIICTSYEQNGIQVDVMNRNFFNFNIMEISHDEAHKSVEDLNNIEYADRNSKTNGTFNEKREIASQADDNTTTQKIENVQEYIVPLFKVPIIQSNDEEIASKLSIEISELPNNAHSEDVIESDLYRETQSDCEASNESIVNEESCSEVAYTENSTKCREESDTQTDILCYESDATEMGPLLEDLSDAFTDGNETNQFSHADSLSVEVNGEAPITYSKNFDDIDTPFMPKNRVLPRTPVKTNPEYSLEVQPKLTKSCQKHRVSNKRKIAIEKIREKKETGLGSHSEESEKSFKKQPVGMPVLNEIDGKTCGQVKHNSPSKWGGCQWRRDLEYAAKAAPCPWADKFENIVQSVKPFASPIVAENEMRRAIDDLYGNSWKKKEEAMLTVIQLTKHHPKVVHDNTSKIVVALSNEIKNFRQSVAGKAILTAGHLYEIMGKNLENKLRLVVAALLAKSGNRTLAAYFRLVIKSLYKIMNSTSPQKVIVAFILEGSRHSNKAARETAAQFLTVLTEDLGPDKSLVPTLSNQIMKCAAMFVADSSPLTRHCGKRMFKVLMENSEFEKMKERQLDFHTTQCLSKVLEQIKLKGVRDEVLPISVIE